MNNAPPVTYALAALDDLIELSAYLREDRGDTAASEMLQQLLRVCESISEFPLRFATDESTGGHFRRVPWKSWLIYYRLRDSIEIVRVLHGARRITADLFSE